MKFSVLLSLLAAVVVTSKTFYPEISLINGSGVKVGLVGTL